MALIGLSFNNAMYAACSSGVLNGSRVAVAKKGQSRESRSNNRWQRVFSVFVVRLTRNLFATS